MTPAANARTWLIEAKSQNIRETASERERFFTAATAASPRARSRATSTSVAPMAASLTLASNPMPDDAPVTRAILPERGPLIATEYRLRQVENIVGIRETIA